MRKNTETPNNTENQIFLIDDLIFRDNEIARIFLISKGVLKSALICDKCDKQKAFTKNGSICGAIYRCTNRNSRPKVLNMEQ